jgi:hypothetical protein
MKHKETRIQETSYKQDTITKLKDTNRLNIGIFNFEFVCILVSCFLYLMLVFFYN